jgi:pterin-4a-carbinolamine dehydratase
MSQEEAAAEKKIADDTHEHFVSDIAAIAHEISHSGKIALAWAAVSIPMAWGMWITLQKALLLFK